MRVLLTGFEPFGNHKTNPTQELMRDWRDRKFFHNHILDTMVLPVSFSQAVPQLQRSILHFFPELVISFGLAEKREDVALEKVALNWVDAKIPDNDGEIPHVQKIFLNQQEALFTNLDEQKLLTHLNTHTKCPVSVSYHAGTYVCNYLYYHLLTMAYKNKFKALFVHVPPSSLVSVKTLNVFLEQLLMGDL